MTSPILPSVEIPSDGNNIGLLQVVAFRTPPLTMTHLQLLRAINRGLPGSVRVLDCQPICLGKALRTLMSPGVQ